MSWPKIVTMRLEERRLSSLRARIDDVLEPHVAREHDEGAAADRAEPLGRVDARPRSG